MSAKCGCGLIENNLMLGTLDAATKCARWQSSIHSLSVWPGTYQSNNHHCDNNYSACVTSKNIHCYIKDLVWTSLIFCNSPCRR